MRTKERLKKMAACILSAAMIISLSPTQSNRTAEAAGDSGGTITIDQTTFPDEEFRTYVLGDGIDRDKSGTLTEGERNQVTNITLTSQAVESFQGIGYFPNLETFSGGTNLIRALDLSGNTKLKNVDISNNDYLTSLNLAGCTEITSLQVNSCAFSELDLTGLSKLQSLDCSNNQLSVLDMSGCMELQSLDCSNNVLTQLEVSGLSKLQSLNCYSNQLISLGISGLTNLKSLSCAYNQLTSLNVSGLSAMQSLNCCNNQLTELNISGLSNLTSLDCSYNQLTAIDLSGLSVLSTLYCQGNQLAELNLSGCTKLGWLNVGDNKLTAIDLSGAKELRGLDVNGNMLWDIDNSANKYVRASHSYNDKYYFYMNSGEMQAVRQESGSYLIDLSDVSGYDKGSLNVQTENSDFPLPELTEKGLYWSENPFSNWSDVDIVLTRKLTKYYFEDKILGICVRVVNRAAASAGKKIAVNESNFPDEGFRNYLKDRYGTVINTANLTNLWLDSSSSEFQDYDIKSLKGIELFENLTELCILNIPCGDVDFGKLVRLDYLTVQNGGLTEFRADGLSGLTYLALHNNQLKTLDLSSCTELGNLYVSNSPLTALDVTQCRKLRSISADNTGIVNLDLSQNEMLEWGNLNGMVTVKIVKNEDGTYTAENELLKSINPGDSSLSSGNESFLSGAIKTDTGWRWPQDPLNGAYVASINFWKNIESGSGQICNASYNIRFINGYDDIPDVKIAINAENFPDEVLRSCLESSLDSYIRDGKVSVLDVDSLDFYSRKIQDFSGIEKFTELSRLNISSIKGAKVLNLKQLEHLTYLNIDNSTLNDIDVSGSPDVSINIYNTNLKRLNVSKDLKKRVNYGMSSGTEGDALTAEQQSDGKYVLALPEWIDAARSFDFSEDIEDGKFVWDTLEDIPTMLSFSYLIKDIVYEEYGDYEEYLDYIPLSFSITNNAPPAIVGKDIPLDEEHFPDEGFRSFLKEQYAQGAGTINTANMAYLWLYNDMEYNGKKYEIKDIKGVEYLEGLQTLEVDGINCQKLDLSQNVYLTYLRLSNCSLSKLDLSSQNRLENLFLYGNALTSLNVTKCTSLRYLDVSSSSLTALNLSKCKRLRTLYAYGNSLTSLDLSENKRLTVLDVSQNALTELDLSVNTKIQELNISGNKFKTLSLSGLKKLTSLSLWADYPIAGLDLSGLSGLVALYVSFSNGEGSSTAIDLEDYPNLQSINVSNMQIKGDLGKLSQLRNVDIWSSSLEQKEIQLADMENLSHFTVSYSGLASLKISGCGGLKDLNVEGNQIKELDVSDCTVLQNLYCDNNQLTSLDVQNSTNLQELSCYSNKLKKLDVTNNEALQSLNCEYNQLYTVDTSHNPALKYFRCSNNPIESLDLSQNKAMLEQVSCYGARLTDLNIEACEELSQVEVYGQDAQVEIYDITGSEEASSVEVVETAVPAEAYGTFVPDALPEVTKEPEKSEEVEVVRGGSEGYGHRGYRSEYPKEPKSGYHFFIDLGWNGHFDVDRFSGLNNFGTPIDSGKGYKYLKKVSGKKAGRKQDGTNPAVIVTDDGLFFKSEADIPTNMQYTYDISNEYKVKNQSMEVSLTVVDKLSDIESESGWGKDMWPVATAFPEAEAVKTESPAAGEAVKTEAPAEAVKTESPVEAKDVIKTPAPAAVVSDGGVVKETSEPAAISQPDATPSVLSESTLPKAETTAASGSETKTDGNTTGSSSGTTATKKPSSSKNACKKLKAAKKTYTIKKKGKKVTVVFKITATNKKKKTTDKLTVKIKNNKIAKVTKKAIVTGKAAITVKGLKKGKTTLTAKVGKQSAKTLIKVN